MPRANEASLYIGLISGTSRDGVDAALVSFENDRPDLLHALCAPYPPVIRDELDELLSTGERPPAGKAAALDDQLGRFFARTARELAEQAGINLRDVEAIGSHGQTVWHQPDGERPVSMQLGNGAIIARSTSITTVTNFRKADLLAGGQGAPLAPLLHKQLFQTSDERRAVLNLGGIANITLLDSDGAVIGFDCGPGNCLMDAWIQKHKDKPYDASGLWAAGGRIEADLLTALLDDPYFNLPAPKSTGLEYFNLNWLRQLVAGFNTGGQDIQCTLAELTAATVAQAVHQAGAVDRLLVCGGGVHNAYLMFRIGQNLPGIEVGSTNDFGADPDWVEAILFAWLARERLAERAQDTPAITGARHPVMLGKIHHSPRP